MATDSSAPMPAQQPRIARSESPSPSLDDGQENTSSPNMLRRVRATIPPVSILALTTVFPFAGWFTLFGPIGVLAWRGGTFPHIGADRPYCQQTLKDVARYQYKEQPSPEVYFGLTYGTTDANIRSVIPKVNEHPNSGAGSAVDGDAVAVAAATKPGSAHAAANQTSKLNPSLDAFGDTVGCSGSWTAPPLLFLLASVGVPVFDTPENSAAATENPWLVTNIGQLMDAYKVHNAFITDKDFSPQAGDIVFYRYPAGLGVYANMVVTVQGNWVTIGGDELGKVGLINMTLHSRGGIVGYGATGYFEQIPLDTIK